ncbi:ATP-dependent RNA helicase DBP9 [Eremomyces bilateralis CBS 781.70]|uniref:RNA helicase n=1 Tax=Eremomyces bilateralis CBS 781.70 TaxID=1392243 RepID=A0A6G1GEQ1_9PEZI|nr:ATP-dependent RNA helicase DBP9 [Eremomyces bilateralis CBS 781.70]KAF1816381.1 ATP-dependent RNA helicase DBP9 [Eremomyces bilateralis CBS 781.70]
MKRKLNEQDVPEVIAEEIPAEAQSDLESEEKVATEIVQASTPAPPASWDSFNFDSRLLKGIAHEKYASPTSIQATAIPLALQSRDILARSKTGSGKTAAYVLPILQSILARKQSSTSSTASKCTAALILVPTRELASQVTKCILALSSFCSQSLRVENIARKEDDKVQRARLAALPDIVVSTPGRAVVHINSSALSLSEVKHLVIDEADLILSYDYGADLETISKTLPTDVQTFLMSATLHTEVESLKGLFCKNAAPAILDLEEQEKDDEDKVQQYVVKSAEDEKFLLAYAIYKLKLLKGKSIIFVGDIDRCYRLKLFFEQVGIKSCILNSELPVNSRIHVVEEFNKGVYDIIIAADENEVIGNEGRKKQKGKEDDEEAETETNGDAEQKSEPAEGEKPTEARPSKKRKSKHPSDKEYGVSRGIDFKHVACVLNFDLPSTSKSYTHRIGRTGRANQTGMALSFVVPKEHFRKTKALSFAGCENDEAVLEKITASQEKKGKTVSPYQFDMAALSGFRYRLQDAIRSVTSTAIREARLRELRTEIVKSEKLKRHFEENPEELRQLRHDGELRPAKVQAHLRHVPEYLLPKGMNRGQGADVGFVGLRKPESELRRSKRVGRRGPKKAAGARGRTSNPLQTFKR